MSVIKNSGFGLFLVVSVVGNIFFIINIYCLGNISLTEHHQLSWSRKAAEEAEAVAAVSCSGHGRAYVDGPLDSYGNPVCECNTCFYGSDCSSFSPICTADAASGDPTFLEPFWMQNAGNSAVLMSGWHRLSYAFGDRSIISEELESRIRELHSLVGNAVTKGKYIIFGVGSSQLLNAAVYALSNHNNKSSPTKVVASIPFYSPYRKQTEFFNSSDFTFKGDTSNLMNLTNANTNIIEFVTSPNNPDGLLKKAVIPGSLAIYDHAYYWPHYTAIPAPVDEDVMLFTLSKLTGHAGSRFGWAVVKDEVIYNRMMDYIVTFVMSVSKDTQLRVLKLIKVILEGNGKQIFEFAHETMRRRWQTLSRILSNSRRFSLQRIPPQFCTFHQCVREPSPAYAWIKCEKEEDRDCNAVLNTASIVGRGGNVFSDDDRYVRLSLIKRQDDFDLLMQHISKLVSQEEIGAKSI